MSSNKKKHSNLIAKIEISKKQFLGEKVLVVFYVTPSFRLISFDSKSDFHFPFEKNKNIDINILENWVSENHYKMSFFTNNSYLKRELIYHFEKPLINNKDSKKKSTIHGQKLFKKIKNIYNKCEI